VSTKLTEEEYTKLLDMCSKNGCTPSALIKEVVLKKLEKKEYAKGLSVSESDELSRKFLAIRLSLTRQWY